MSNPWIDIAPPATVRRMAPRLNGLWVLLGLIVVMALLPMVASPYALLLMLPLLLLLILLLLFE